MYTRWGRVGEPGQQATKEHSNKEDGIKDFKKKFTDKTKNKWENRANFEPKPGKYTLLEMDDDDDEADEVRGQGASLERSKFSTHICRKWPPS